MKTFNVSAELQVPLMDLKGRDYLQVAYRIVWFRYEHPTWAIETSFDKELGAFLAEIKDESGRVIAMAHKSLNSERKMFPFETCETGAIGRALALCGYGTAFCGDELNEAEDLADAPIEPVRHAAQANVSEKPAIQAKPPALRSEGISEAQVKRLWAIAKKHGWDEQDVRRQLEAIGLEHTRDLNYFQYQKLTQNIEAFPKVSDAH